MSDPPPSALIMKPQDGVHQNMCLDLQNHNYFLTSSSTCSSSSSPDSTCSLSSLNVELAEEMSGRKTTTNKDDSGIQSPDFGPEDNDNSVSVYLDAKEECWHAECNNRENVSIIQNHESDDVFRDAAVDGERERQGSADSSATEAQLFAPENEDGGDEDEDSFLSVRSADVLLWQPSELEQSQMCEQDFVGPMIDLQKEAFQDSEDYPNEEGQMCSSTMSPSLGPAAMVHQETFQNTEDNPNEKGQMYSSTMNPRIGLAAEVHQEAFQDSADHPNEEGQMCSSTMGPAAKVHQETFQDSEDNPNEKGQMHSSTMNPRIVPAAEVHQEAFQNSADHPNEEGQMCSSTIKPSVAFISTVHREAFQHSVVPTNEEGQISSSAIRPSVSLVSELHQEAYQVISRSMMQRATKETDVDIGSELHHKVHQKTVELHKKQEQVECSNRSLAVDSVSLEVLKQSLEFHSEENHIHTAAKRPNMNLVSEIHQEAVLTDIAPATEKSPYQPHETMSPSVFQTAPPYTTIRIIKDLSCFSTINISQNLTDPPAQSHTRSPMKPPKFKSTEVKQFSRPNLMGSKPEVISRAASIPRPAITDQSQSAACCETNSLITRSRAAKKREQGDDGGRNRASSTQARSATSPTISDSESKSTWLPVVEEQTPDFLGSKVVANGRTASLKVTETLRKEKDSYKERVVLKEDTRDGDVEQNVSSDLRPSAVGTRVPNRGCVSAVVRAAPLSGVPKMRVIDSNSTVSGSVHSWKAPLKSASSKLPIKSGSLPTSLSSSSVGSTTSENKGVAQVMKSEETCGRPSLSSQGKSASTKPAAGVRNRANTAAKLNTAGQKATAHVIHTKTTQNALHRGGSGRPGRNSASVCPSSRGPRGTRPAQTHAEVEEEKKNRSILQLRSLVAHGNRRLEALAVVVQHIFNEREEALKQKKETSIHLKNLREELAQSVLRSERLEREKASVCAQLDATVLSLQQQHREELTQLEDRLGDFYAAEWDKTHQVYQEEADRCTALMRQQVEEVRSKQEALRTEQEVTHGRQIEELRQGYQAVITELQKSHERDRQELDHTLKSSEAALNERIVSLMKENETLRERLRDTEEKRRTLTDKNQRDSRIVYLEQELESLKVVLDIKTNQLHQQDKKLMQMDKLMESNVKLEEFVTKLQQENEDYKARMDKHAELSRQLSTEQVMLQQTLQKESKANKRLSMENEELLWKLHNGLSPRNSASFPSSPISPR